MIRMPDLLPLVGRFALFVAVAMVILTGRHDAVAARPNIIFVMADDLGYGDLGSYGQKRVMTPRLDQMAREGMRFTQFYAGSTVCAPSRCVLMTGLHTGHCFIRGNGKDNLRPDDVTVAEVLQPAGYTSGLIGKWGAAFPRGRVLITSSGIWTNITLTIITPHSWFVMSNACR